MTQWFDLFFLVMKDYFFFSIRSAGLTYVIWLWIVVALTIVGCVLSFLHPISLFGFLVIGLLGFLPIYQIKRFKRRMELKRGLSRHFDGRKIKIEAIIGSLDDNSQSAIVRMGNTFLRFDIQCMKMEHNLEYTVYTNPVSALDVEWFVDKKANTRKRFVQVLQDNGVEPGEIDSRRLVYKGNCIYTMPCGEDFVAICYPHGMKNRVVLIKKERESLFISLVRLMV